MLLQTRIPLGYSHKKGNEKKSAQFFLYLQGETSTKKHLLDCLKKIQISYAETENILTLSSVFERKICPKMICLQAGVRNSLKE